MSFWCAQKGKRGYSEVARSLKMQDIVYPTPPWRIRCLQADKNYHLGASSAKINVFQSYFFVIIEHFSLYSFKSAKCPIGHFRIEFELKSPWSPFSYMPVDPGFVDCLYRHTRGLYLSLFLSEFAKNDCFVCLKICLKSFTDPLNEFWD